MTNMGGKLILKLRKQLNPGPIQMKLYTQRKRNKCICKRYRHYSKYLLRAISLNVTYFSLKPATF